MTTEILKPEEKKVSIIDQYTNEQIQVIKQHVAPTATDTELVYFLNVCKQQNLDPLAKQIYFMKRGGQMTIQTGIDGYRAMAEQSGSLGGIDDVEYEEIQGSNYPKKASVTVYKFISGNRVPFTASARWTEYFPGDKMGFMWKKMPFLMLGKVAEALALRKAFPKNLGGIYTKEEMDSVNTKPMANVSNADNLVQTEEMNDTGIRENQHDKILKLIKEKGKNLVDMLKYFKLKEITEFDIITADKAIQLLESMPEAKKKVTKKKVVKKKAVKKAEPVEPIEGEIEEMPEEEIIGLPEDVCQLINFFTDIDKSEWPEVVEKVMKDSNTGAFKGTNKYKGLQEEIDKLPK